VADPATLEPRFALDSGTFGKEVTGMSFDVDGDTLYVASGVKGDGEHVTAIRCYALDARDGTKRWAKTLQYRKHFADRYGKVLEDWLQVDAVPRVADGTVGVLTNTGHLFGIDVGE
jgi:outer membrane protein assembly factor BamB